MVATRSSLTHRKTDQEVAGKTMERSDSGIDTHIKEVALDSRHPLYLGDWKRAKPNVDDDIRKDTLDEPHVKRRHTILDKHPEIRQYYGIDPWTKWVTLAGVVTQVALAYLFGRVYVNDNWTMAIVSYVVGASITQLFGVIIHEATHCLCFETPLYNKLLGLTANIGIVFPIFASFRRYHLDHHAFQGVIGRDPDLPLQWEYKFVKGNPFAKFLFLFFYPMMYVVRGAALQKRPSQWELINWAFTITTDALIYYYCGARGLLYLFMSLWLGYGIHPAAAHFIQEHFTFEDGQETYSYYGSFNYFFLNIGYHNEHHDFTKVPWSNLPKVKKAAPEFYDTIASHQSWFKVQWDFLFDKTIGPISRVGREYEMHRKGRRMIVERKGKSEYMTATKTDEDNQMTCSL